MELMLVEERLEGVEEEAPTIFAQRRQKFEPHAALAEQREDPLLAVGDATMAVQAAIEATRFAGRTEQRQDGLRHRDQHQHPVPLRRVGQAQVIEPQTETWILLIAKGLLRRETAVVQRDTLGGGCDLRLPGVLSTFTHAADFCGKVV